jgi:hypothetical protein
MKTGLYLILIMMAIYLSSCTLSQPISTTIPANNKTYQVEYLFEHDGCKIYRFKDLGQWVYFTNCGNSVTSVASDSTQVRVIEMNKATK